MASISTAKNGLKKLEFSFRGKRHQVLLGRIEPWIASEVKRHVEAIAVSAKTITALPEETIAWLSKIEGELLEKLEKTGVLNEKSDEYGERYIEIVQHTEPAKQHTEVGVPKLALSPKEAAVAIGVSEKTLWSITAPRGMLKCCKVGTRTLYRPSDIDAFLIESQECI